MRLSAICGRIPAAVLLLAFALRILTFLSSFLAILAILMLFRVCVVCCAWVCGGVLAVRVSLFRILRIVRALKLSAAHSEKLSLVPAYLLIRRWGREIIMWRLTWLRCIEAISLLILVLKVCRGIREGVFGRVEGLLYGLHNRRGCTTRSERSLGFACNAHGALLVALLLLRL